MKIFLSYSDVDEDFARELSGHLSRAGNEVLDPAQNLIGGQNWHLEIGRALDESDAFVVLVSPEAARSPWQRHEIDYALTQQRFEGRLVPVFLKPTPEAPWILQKLAHIKGTDPEKVADRILRQLKTPAER
jgi:hypothetical protein